MYNLLIVDDEPIIVDVLSELLQSAITGNMENIEIHLAYSSREALAILQKIHVDIVLTDIRMPEINGLQLQEFAMNLWPHCKFIFLTGFDDFQSAQHAVRHKAVDYILKNEDDDKIVAAILRAKDQIESERSDVQMLEKAKRQYALATPKLREEYLSDLLTPDRRPVQINKEQFLDLKISMDSGKDVMVLISRVDEWPQSFSPGDCTLMHFAISNIAEECMGAFANTASFVYDRQLIVWFLQPKSGSETEWKRFRHLVGATLDTIQLNSSTLLKLPLSLSLCSSPLPWDRIHLAFSASYGRLRSGAGPGQGVWVVEAPIDGQYNPSLSDAVLTASRLKSLETLLEDGKLEGFMDFILQIEQSWSIAPPRNEFIILRQYFDLAGLLFDYAGRLKISERLQELELRVGAMYASAAKWSPAERAKALRELACEMFKERKRLQDDESQRMIQKVKAYVEANRGNDVSLSAAASYVYLSPSYFSRLFKQASGMKFSDYISMEKIAYAKHQLTHTHKKIHEIAEALGFESAAYFTYFFRKFTDSTPSEYRRLHAPQLEQEINKE